MQNELPKKWNTLYTISMFSSLGSYVALKLLNDKELLPWLKPEIVPYFGFPLLVILCASCIFGAKGLLNVASNLNDRVKRISEMERKYKEEQKNEK